MLKLAILPTDFKSLEKDFVVTKNDTKVKDKDFAQALEKERNKVENKISEEKTDVAPTRKEDLKSKKFKDTEIEEYTLPEASIDETNYYTNFIHGLALNLDLLTEDLDNLNLEELGVIIEQLSSLLTEMDLQENTIIPIEDYQRLVETINLVENILDDLVLPKDNQNIPISEMAQALFPELEAELASLKDLLEDVGFNLENKERLVDQPQLELEEDIDIVIPEESNLYEASSKELELNDGKKLSKGEADVEIVNTSSEEPMDDEVELNIPYQVEDKLSTRSSPDIEIEEFEAIDKKQVFEQIVEKAKLVVDQNRQEIRIRLKPDLLGELVLKMEMEDKGILAKVMVDNYRTKELIETNLFLLKEEMKENGLEIKTFEVFVGTNEDFQRENRQEFFLNHKPQKIKARKGGLNEFQAYEEKTINRVQDNYHDGQLNLLA